MRVPVLGAPPGTEVAPWGGGGHCGCISVAGGRGLAGCARRALAANCPGMVQTITMGLCVPHAEVSELCVGAVLLMHSLQTRSCAACLAGAAAVGRAAAAGVVPIHVVPISRPVCTALDMRASMHTAQSSAGRLALPARRAVAGAAGGRCLWGAAIAAPSAICALSRTSFPSLMIIVGDSELALMQPAPARAGPAPSWRGLTPLPCVDPFDFLHWPVTATSRLKLP